jgi:hypothetical protein
MDQELVDGLTTFAQLLNKKLPLIKAASAEEEKANETPAGLARIAPEWAKNIKSILFTEQQIANRVREMAAEISKCRFIADFVLRWLCVQSMQAVRLLWLVF